MADASQHSIKSVSPGSLAKDLGWKGSMRHDEEPPDQDFASKASCPICGRDNVLLQIGGVNFCAACGYASDGTAGCT